MDKNKKSFTGGKLKLKVKKKIHKKEKDVKKEVSKEERVKENIVCGSGRIVTTKNTVQGFETKFIEEVKSGYEIILNHPTSLQTERRIVTSVLSNKTLLVNEEFSSDITTTCAFYIHKIETDEKENEQDNYDLSNVEYAKILKQKEKEDVIKIRKKVGLWSYKVVDKKIKGHLTNEQKLDERVKHSRDKFCW